MEQITTTAELDALPVEAILRSAGGTVVEKWQNGYVTINAPVMFDSDEIADGFAPLEVIYRPDRPAAGVLPSQLDVLGAIYGKRQAYRSDEIANARAVLALLPGRSEAEVRAEVLDEIEDFLDTWDETRPGEFISTARMQMLLTAMKRDRADRLEAEARA